MRPFSAIAFVFAGMFLFTTGCATHSKNAGSAIARMRAGDTVSALRWAEKLERSVFSKDLGYLESGRIKMLSGDFAGSRADFATAIDTILAETETGPAIRMGSIGSTLAASTVTDDTLRKYDLSPYEIIQLLHYQTLNYLFSGDPQGASVEMRRTVFAQDAIAEKYSKEIAKAQEHANKTQTAAMDAVQSRMAIMGPALERTRSSYENGMAWYFCGLMFEKQGDAANASLCYRKAWELSPGNTCILKDFLRMLRTQDQQAFGDLVLQQNMDVKKLTRGPTEIVVLYEEALISERQTIKIPIPIPDFRGAITLVSVDFPFYRDAAYIPTPLELSENGAVFGVTEPGVYLQSLAYHDLKDKILGVVVRNVTRAATKVAMQQVANNRDGDNHPDLMRFGMMAINAASSIASTSDTRAWYSIPMVTHLYRGSLSAGTHTVECRNSISGVTLKIPVTILEGETRVIWIADTGGIAVAATASLSGKGLPPAFYQFNNPFCTNTVPVSLSGPAGTSQGVESPNSKGSKETAL